jgi:hypothetical protein
MGWMIFLSLDFLRGGLIRKLLQCWIKQKIAVFFTKFYIFVIGNLALHSDLLKKQNKSASCLILYPL